jgi:CO/xanthine dehydrogenase FAD-binding subunit
MPVYARPTRVDEALKLRARGGYTVLAGGTDFYPARVGKPSSENILDLTAIEELRGIREQADHWRFGAAATWTEIVEARLPPLFDCLKLAAREIGGRQIQNAGTVAGNLCNASPAADGVPALLALNASVEVANAGGRRRLPVDQFIVGPRQTVLGPDEIVTAVVVQKPAHPAKSHFLKLGARKYLVISIAMAAAVIEHADGIVRAARVAVGACSPVAMRLPLLEEELSGRPLGTVSLRSEHFAPLSPIDDVRASARYRRDAAPVLVKRLLDQLR